MEFYLTATSNSGRARAAQKLELYKKVLSDRNVEQRQSQGGAET